MKITRMAALIAATGLAMSGCSGGASGGGGTTIRISANSVKGGKNSSGAEWITDYVIPKFTAMEKAKGKKVTVRFEGTGVDDAPYKQKTALDLKTGGGADLINIDGIWVGEFAQAGYVRPLNEVVGAQVDRWDGLQQIPGPVQNIMAFDGKKYGLPSGTDGRVVFYNKQLFAKAGLPADWQPKSWDDILAAGRKLKSLSGVTPIQLNAGTAMTEATTMQGVLPLLVGTGHEIYENGRWLGDTAPIRSVLDLYRQVYTSGLGDPRLQQNPQGRDESFQRFSKNKVGILLESDYFWRSVVNPKGGIDPMPDRDKDVGYTLIPAQSPGKGIRAQNAVSMSGGSGWVINPHTKNASLVWDLLSFMGSHDAVKDEVQRSAVGISPRQDVNAELLGGDPLLNFISTKVLPITDVRPGLAAYPQVSTALQKATGDVVAGDSVDKAVKAYQQNLTQAVGGAGHVTTG
ncbi:extracellular solute-binding protein [Actinoallomurus iriomotensis]|uniref:Sugar ABC transporter substrate-binding protein n=1 Tax=Actinoallomurus iriomotensis TaxID=478107 RepID=A0A9W6S9U9_9ACTN|nr:extracellular solute-binding protein [Actinoallomurus iriomotensis]GLY90960.1 sugar ABC transporter substrate-binding protein [Actinoallomurus iriomotensis]